MEKLKQGDMVRIKKVPFFISDCYKVNDECEIKFNYESSSEPLSIWTEDKSDYWYFDYDDVEKVNNKENEQRSIKKGFKQWLKYIRTWKN